MSVTHKLHRLLSPFALLVGSLGGVPMLPEDILELMHATHQQKIVQLIADADTNDDDEMKKLLGSD